MFTFSKVAIVALTAPSVVGALLIKRAPTIETTEQNKPSVGSPKAPRDNEGQNVSKRMSPVAYASVAGIGAGAAAIGSYAMAAEANSRIQHITGLQNEFEDLVETYGKDVLGQAHGETDEHNRIGQFVHDLNNATNWSAKELSNLNDATHWSDKEYIGNGDVDECTNGHVLNLLEETKDTVKTEYETDLMVAEGLRFVALVLAIIVLICVVVCFVSKYSPKNKQGD